MPTFNVIMTSSRLAEPAVRLLESAGCVIHYMPPYPSAAAVAALAAKVQADAILCRQGRVDGTAMDASPRLRIIARHGVGVDEVDVPAAAERNLLVTRAPGSNTQAVAEHTLAVLLALAKSLPTLTATIAGGGWRGAGAETRDVAGMRLGLVGFGAVGQEVARLALAFGMHVSAYDPAGAEAAFAARPAVAHAVTLEALLPATDALSLHCPLTRETHHMIGSAALARMPPGAFIINTARGGLVDEVALEAALESGQIAGAALDVFETEPPPPDHPLRHHPKVIATPHVAGVTPQALVNMGVMAAECIVAALTGKPVPPERIVVGA